MQGKDAVSVGRDDTPQGRGPATLALLEQLQVYGIGHCLAAGIVSDVQEPGTRVDPSRGVRVAAIAWDMMDECPSGCPGFGMAVHLAIPFLGLALIDNVDRERLAQACAEQGRNEFLFTARPLRLVGATGVPAHPIAIF